jgi:hypothetical protein
MKAKLGFVCILAGLALAAVSGCTTHEPVYVSPPPVAGSYTPPPAGVPPPGQSVAPPATVPEPPAGTAVTASVPPPAPPMETAPPAPGPDYVWTPGYYNWNGVAWVWAPGIWVVPPYRGAVWFRGGWVYRGGRAYWSRGRWR